MTVSTIIRGKLEGRRVSLCSRLMNHPFFALRPIAVSNVQKPEPIIMPVAPYLGEGKKYNCYWYLGIQHLYLGVMKL